MMDRRAALQLIALGVAAPRAAVAQEHLHALKTEPRSYVLQFFTPAEDRLIDHIAEMIIPSDDRSPGAHAAQVSKYIDLVVFNSRPEVQAKWKSGITALGNFLDLPPAAKKSALNKLAAAERHPGTPAERFFVEMKSMTIFGYYTSQLGLVRELGYKGNEALATFPGCTG